MQRVPVLGVLIIGAVIAAAACDRGSSSSSGSERNVQLAEVNGSKTRPSSTKVAKIVFVDQQRACDCTRNRIDATWNALQKALGSPASIPVERLYLDTQAEQLEPYFMMERVMVPPGIYLLEEGNGVIRLLQGEVSEQQFRQALRE